MAKKRKLEKPLLFSTYRDRGAVYGQGNNSGNDECSSQSFDPEYLTESLCYICGTTRGDPLLRPIKNKLGAGREYYFQYCGDPYEKQGSSGFVSRGPALYGLFLEKVNKFYSEHEEHVMENRQWIETEGKFPIYHPAGLHVEYWGIDLEYPKSLLDVASRYISETDKQIESGIMTAPKDYNTVQKTAIATIIEFLKKQPNWFERKDAFERYEERANKIGTYRTDPILPIEQSIFIKEDDNLDDFFDYYGIAREDFEQEQTEIQKRTDDDEEEIPF